MSIYSTIEWSRQKTMNFVLGRIHQATDAELERVAEIWLKEESLNNLIIVEDE